MDYDFVKTLKDESINSRNLGVIEGAYKIVQSIMANHRENTFMHNVCRHTLVSLHNAELEIYALHPEKWKG